MKSIVRVRRTVVSHIAFRIGIAVASAALTVWLLLGVALRITYYAPMSRSESLAASVMAAAFSIPTLFGVVILLPQTKAWVRWVGASVVFFAAPVFFAALRLVSSYVETFSEEFYWILLWILGAIVYWALLRPLPSMSLDTEVNKDEEQHARGNQ